MKYVHIKQIKGTKSLYGSFLYITLLPLILFGVVIMIYSSLNLTKNIQTEMCNNLRNVGVSVLTAFNVLYEGDYNVIVVGNEVELYKGDVLLSGDYTILDHIKEETNVDITIFFYDTRVLTTIMDKDGNRFINSGANATILNDVVIGKNSNFYTKAQIDSKQYFAYYQPIFSEDGKTTLGMIGLATPAKEVSSMVRQSVLQNILIMLLALLITTFAILHFSSGIISIIKKIMTFLGQIAEGDLSAELDQVVMDRPDELGEMGRLSVKLRGSLRKLIEKDALTGIYNRRYAQNRLKEIMDKGTGFSIAIGDIDNFKNFNDKYGHECGDVVLKEVSRTLSDSMRANGFAARWGGEEFLLVFENIDDLAAAAATENILDRIRERLVEYNGEVHAVTMSFGVVGGRFQLSLDENINNADALLYEAKVGGRNRVVSG